MRLDPNGDEIALHIFHSDDLTDHWQRLDAFEGSAMQRIPVMVESQDGTLEASIYVIAE